ncbi:MAG TPA: glycosyltransferase family 4 protein [Terriglobales bacterium]|nr:glycosyltransferase family 4 protein [Terriglobales bacterium]
MRIGFVSQTFPYLPSRDGFRIYGANLIRTLAARHEIELISIVNGESACELAWADGYCARVYGIAPPPPSLPGKLVNLVSLYARGRPLTGRHELNAALRRGAAERRWDVLHVEGRTAGGMVDGPALAPSVLSLHDAESLRATEMRHCPLTRMERIDYALTRRWGPRYDRMVYPRFDCNTVVSGRDAEFLRDLVPRARFEVIPHGIDADYFQPLPGPKNPYEIVFHGHLGYPPNVQAASDFARDVLPLIRRQVPRVRLHLVGANPREEVLHLAADPAVRISANLPDLRAAVSLAAVYVCPVRYGTGLKNKLLEAMAMRMPVVAYHPGSTSGIECVLGKHLLGASEPEDFARQVVTLLAEPARAENLAAAARNLILERYSWESRARTYEALYKSVIARHAAAAA